tara:strand:+ start:1689 stop:2093 length:405 start_codon:yes stop_codon:yes gene_type:complete
MKLFKLIFFLSITLLFFACKNPQKIEPVTTVHEDCNYKKIKFDLFELDKRGQMGTENNKTTLDFEFCIPNKVDFLMEVKNIDSSLKSQKGKGRSNCSEEHLLIVGNTYNKDFKKILCKISQLEYVKEINQIYWE